jgi:hypothetical protein
MLIIFGSEISNAMPARSSHIGKFETRGRTVRGCSAVG